MRAKLNQLAHEYLDIIQHLVSSPIWVMGNIVFWTIWMVGMLVSQLLWGRAFDSPLAFFPGTIWAMTVMGYWIELAMKAQTTILYKIQQEQDTRLQDQIDRIENMAKANSEILEYLKHQDERHHRMIYAIKLIVEKLSEMNGGDDHE